ncbi:MAG: hypothetical protein HQK51_00345 [Oligoflexia bacterium]|nr:hypothetical protein [Oligoflexia bacterium]
MDDDKNKKPVGRPSKQERDKALLCSIRMETELKNSISSLAYGLTTGIRFLYKFYLKWKNIDVEIKTNLKILSLEFSQTADVFLKAKEAEKITESNLYYQMMVIQSQQIKRLYKIIESEDKDGSFIESLFLDKKYLEYLKFIWKKHI